MALLGTNIGTPTSVSGQAGSVANAVTFDNSGSGAASGTTYNGSAAKTVSTNTIGALKASNNLSDVASVNTANRNLQAGYIIDQSAVAVPHTGDTTETTLATITIPANAMGANGRIAIELQFSSTNNANAKTARVKFGGTTFNNLAFASVAQQPMRSFIANRNATNSQVGTPTSGLGTGAVAVVTSAIDTTASVTLLITGQLATSTDTITLESYQVILYPKA